jgi:hypothetical protein
MPVTTAVRGRYGVSDLLCTSKPHVYCRCQNPWFLPYEDVCEMWDIDDVVAAME